MTPSYTLQKSVVEKVAEKIDVNNIFDVVEKINETLHNFIFNDIITAFSRLISNMLTNPVNYLQNVQAQYGKGALEDMLALFMMVSSICIQLARNWITTGNPMFYDPNHVAAYEYGWVQLIFYPVDPDHPHQVYDWAYFRDQAIWTKNETFRFYEYTPRRDRELLEAYRHLSSKELKELPDSVSYQVRRARAHQYDQWLWFRRWKAKHEFFYEGYNPEFWRGWRDHRDQIDYMNLQKDSFEDSKWKENQEDSSDDSKNQKDSFDNSKNQKDSSDDSKNQKDSFDNSKNQKDSFDNSKNQKDFFNDSKVKKKKRVRFNLEANTVHTYTYSNFARSNTSDFKIFYDVD